MNIGGYTATGPRDANEDNLYYLDFSGLDSFVNGICAFAMVSDGMGGYQGGDVASGLAVACAKSYLSQLVDMAGENRIDLDASAALVEIVQNAHESILAESSARGNLSMGATFVGAFVSPTHAWIGHVGDSRAYLVRAGECRQLTEDHSQVGRMLSRGILTEDEAQNHPDRNRIERALGFNDARPDVTEIDLEQGDSLVLCSDGVYTVLDAATLGSCIDRSSDAEEAAKRAVKLALRRRTDDNSTAVVVINGERSAAADRTVRQTPVTTTPTGTQVDLPTPVMPQGDTSARPSVRARRTRGEGATWKVALPLVLGFVLVGAAVWMALQGHLGGTESGAGEVTQGEAPTAAPATDESAEAPEMGQEPSQTTDPSMGQEPTATPEQTTEMTGTSDTTLETSYESYTVPQDAYLELKYIDATGTAQLFTYSPLSLSQAPQLLPGATLTAETTPDSYGRVEMTYQALSDSYLEDLKRDISRYAEGSTEFDSELSEITEASSYLAFVQELSQMDSATLNETVAHLAIESLIVTEQ